MSRYLDTSTDAQKAKIMVHFRAESVRSSFVRTIMGTAIRESCTEIRLRKVPNWKCFFVNREKDFSVYVDGIKLAGKTETIEPTWKFHLKVVDLGEPTFLDVVYLGCKQRECKISNDMVASYRDMLESRVSAGAKDNYRPAQQGNVMQKKYLLALMTWKVT